MTILCSAYLNQIPFQQYIDGKCINIWEGNLFADNYNTPCFPMDTIQTPKNIYKYSIPSQKLTTCNANNKTGNVLYLISQPTSSKITSLDDSKHLLAIFFESHTL